MAIEICNTLTEELRKELRPGDTVEIVREVNGQDAGFDSRASYADKGIIEVMNPDVLVVHINRPVQHPAGGGTKRPEKAFVVKQDNINELSIFANNKEQRVVWRDCNYE